MPTVITLDGLHDFSPAEATISAVMSEPTPVSTVAEPVLYASDHRAFQAVYSAARTRFKNGENPLTETYQTENVLPFHSEPIPFGVEIEFDADSGYENGEWDDDEDAYTDCALAQTFYERGWTPTPQQEGYHARYNSTSRSHRGGWRFEHDGSVSGGEMISPILTDTPETWNTLRDVVDTIKSHGGTSSRQVGAHVHVDTTTIQDDVEKFTRLLRIFWVFEDVLFRLAANPHGTGFHRGVSYCVPNRLQASGYEDLRTLVRTNGSHNHAINTSSVTSYGVGHVEMRLWDGSLDPAVIQAHIKISVAMVAAAADSSIDAILDTLIPEPRGTHRSVRREINENNRAGANLSGRAWRGDTERFRQFVDMLFTRPEDKAQITTLFSMNKWSHSPRSRY